MKAEPLFYQERILSTVEDLEGLITPTPDWKYGFAMEATTLSGGVYSHTTEPEPHDEFIKQAEHMEKLRDLVCRMLKGEVDNGVLTLGQRVVRASSIETFFVAPVAYEPVWEEK